jgi:hypothetical protein
MEDDNMAIDLTKGAALYQLAFDLETYGNKAGWWLVTTADHEDELAGPYETDAEARAWIRQTFADRVNVYWHGFTEDADGQHHADIEDAERWTVWVRVETDPTGFEPFDSIDAHDADFDTPEAAEAEADRLAEIYGTVAETY